MAPVGWGLAGSRSRRRVLRLADGAPFIPLHVVGRAVGRIGLIGAADPDPRVAVLSELFLIRGAWHVRPVGELPIPVVAGGTYERRDGITILWVSGALDGQQGIYRLQHDRADARWESPQLVLRPEGAGEMRVGPPCVMRLAGVEHVWYAVDEDDRSSIRLATHEDPADWMLHGAVLEPGAFGDADHAGVGAPAVRHHGRKLVMAYEGRPSGSLLLACSRDGRTWAKRGHLVFRGSAGAPDEMRIGRPSLRARPGQGLLLSYAGQDVAGRWSTMETIVSNALLERSDLEEPQLSQAEMHRTLALVSGIARRFVRLRLGPIKQARDRFRSPDGRVVQLFPSSTPVFAVTTETDQVVKFGRSSSFVEREYDRASALRPFAPVVPMALRYLDGRALLVTPRVDGRPLDRLADDDLFRKLVERLAANATRAMRATLRPYDPSLVDLSTQAPNVLLARMSRFDNPTATRLESVGDLDDVVRAPMTLNGTTVASSFLESVERAKTIIADPPTWLAYGDADLKCEHQLVPFGDETFVGIDLEYAGWFDLDWLVHVLLHALVTESGAAESIEAALVRGELNVVFEPRGEYWDEFFDSRWALGQLEGLPVNRDRVFAYFVATMADYLLDYDQTRKREALVWYGALKQLLEVR